ncbi:MAG: Xaa-Pro dipeptidyl-peptidase [Frankiales bacterium]|jgi:X-Pro dipeptidyl-peptidase|nr:Xaa-Pro dipeptidyl-peptidase [Frankiales bacterium]
MRSRTVLAAAAAVLGAALAVPASAASGLPEPAQLQQVDGEETRSYSVPTRHGSLYLEVVHPTRGGKVLPAHGILTVSPYSVLGRNGDAADYVPRGYARMYADVVGTGNSGGCYDYGGTREKESAHDVVEWVAKQPWSRGRIGMTGGSYDGTTATGAAVTKPKGLATIVPEAAISRWYDYAYSGGMRYTYTNEPLGHQGPGAATDEGFDTPLAFDFGFAVPPPTDVTAPDWADRVADAMRVCDELQHTEKGYDLTPDYDAFWVERDYAREAPGLDLPVMVVHNWGDWNVKQDTALRLWQALPRGPRTKLYMGDRFSGHGTPGGDYRQAKLTWMDRWVGGVKNGVERTLPAVTSQTSTSAGAGRFLAGPAPKAAPVVLGSTAGLGLAPGAGKAAAGPTVPFSVVGSESLAMASLTPGVHGDAVVLVSAPLTRDVRMFGSPAVKVGLATGRTWTTLAPSVVDVDPAGSFPSVPVTRGWLDTRYAKGLAKAQPADGTGIRTTVVAKPSDWTFQKGHRIALVVQTASLEWTAPKPYDGIPSPTYALELGPATSLTLPLVGAGDVRTLFARS